MAASSRGASGTRLARMASWTSRSVRQRTVGAAAGASIASHCRVWSVGTAGAVPGVVPARVADVGVFASLLLLAAEADGPVAHSRSLPKRAVPVVAVVGAGAAAAVARAVGAAAAAAAAAAPGAAELTGVDSIVLSAG